MLPQALILQVDSFGGCARLGDSALPCQGLAVHRSFVFTTTCGGRADVVWVPGHLLSVIC